MTQTTCRRPRHCLLQRLVRLPRQRRHRQQLQTTAARTVWCVWSGNETASHLSYAATLVSALLVSTESSIWAPAGRFVALISRWWWVSINEHCSYTRVLQFHALQMTCKLVRHFYVRPVIFSQPVEACIISVRNHRKCVCQIAYTGFRPVQQLYESWAWLRLN